MAFFDNKNQAAANVNPEEVECDRRLAELAQRRAEMIMQIGMTFLGGNKPEDVAGTPYAPFVNTVAEIDQQTVYLEKRKLAIRGLRKCENCGNILVLDSSFCNKCGNKLEPLFAEENRAQHICPQCGSAYAEGAVFCTSCGNKLS